MKPSFNVFIVAIALFGISTSIFATLVADREAVLEKMKANNIAAIQKDIAALEKLTGEKLANTDIGREYFTLAVEHGTPTMVTMFLDKGFDVDSQNGPMRFTPLMLAAIQGNTGVVNLLLDRGADTKSLNMLFQTALDLASNSSSRELIRNYAKARGKELSDAWGADEKRRRELKAIAKEPEHQPAQHSRYPLNLIAEYAGVELPATAPASAADVSSSAALAPGQGEQPTEMEEEFTAMDTGGDMDTSE